MSEHECIVGVYFMEEHSYGGETITMKEYFSQCRFGVGEDRIEKFNYCPYCGAPVIFKDKK